MVLPQPSCVCDVYKVEDKSASRFQTIQLRRVRKSQSVSRCHSIAVECGAQLNTGRVKGNTDSNV